MKNGNKFVAGVSALAMITAMMTTVSAVSIPEVPNSAFSYELRAEAVSDTQIKVSFQVTNNPGVFVFSIALQFDENCTPCDWDQSINCFNTLSYEQGSNSLIYAMGIVPEQNNGQQETFENFSVDFWFNVDADSDSSCRFSTAIISYNSLTEGIQYDKALIDGGYDSDTAIETYPYLLGDVDNDGRIRVEDALRAFSIASYYEAVYESPLAPVSRINYNVENNISSTLENGKVISWGTQFSYLMRSGYSCAEAADVDQSGYIEEADGNAILQYYADRAAALPVETLIGTTQVKTVTITL